MQLRYEDDLVEGAVFALASNRRRSPAARQVWRFHRARERCYEVADPDERNSAFFKVHLEWFREWGLEKGLLGLLSETPLLRPALTTLVFRKARLKNDEGAELYVSPETGRAGVIALRAERFASPSGLEMFLRHELMHLHDMVDPAFGYSPDLHFPLLNAAQQRLVRERYRLLWAICIDARITASSRPTMVTREHHRVAFDRAFSFEPEEKRSQLFEALWTNRPPCHNDLLAIADDPRHLETDFDSRPGAPCPLCGFTTFDWASTQTLPPQTVSLIQKEFAAWLPANGLCQRCGQIYSSVRPLAGEPYLLNSSPSL